MKKIILVLLIFAIIRIHIIKTDTITFYSENNQTLLGYNILKGSLRIDKDYIVFKSYARNRKIEIHNIPFIIEREK